MTALILDIDALIGDPQTRIVVCCGAGGVGKTTVAAALGLRSGRRCRGWAPSRHPLGHERLCELTDAVGVDALRQRRQPIGRSA